jgi:molecular chaperone IbpA
MTTAGNYFGYIPFPTLLDVIAKKQAYGLGICDYLSEIAETLESCAKQTTAHPPYDILRLEGEKQVIELAVAGFAHEELSVSTEDGILTISGKRHSPSDAEFIHRGIARRDFQKCFKLSDDTVVEKSELVNGILRVYLLRVLPEAKRKRLVPINKQ